MSDGTIGTKQTFTEGGFYNLILSYECENTEFEIYSQQEKCELMTFVPNAFTPDFDGYNDKLFPFFFGRFSNY